jgi:AcrR family transcriptional regulator
LKTKEKILQKAIELFNREGVEQVTTLSISKEMGISLGNLHYHYPNRDALIVAIVDRFLSDMEILSQELIHGKSETFMERAFRTQFMIFREIWKYRFIFSDRLVIARRTDYLEIHFKAMLQHRKRDFDMTMIELKRIGLMRADISPEASEAHFQQIVMWNNSWVAYYDLFEYDGPPYLYFAEQSIWAWWPYLNCSDEEIRAVIAKIKPELTDSL